MARGLLLLLLMFLVLPMLSFGQETRKKPGKPSKPVKPKPTKPKGCLDENGLIYNKGETVQDGCYKKTCHKRKRKYYWKNTFMLDFCCITKGKDKFIEHGKAKLVKGILFFCNYGKLEKVGKSQTLTNETIYLPEKSVLERIEKLDKICTQIVSLGKSVKSLVMLVGSRYEEMIINEIKRIVRSHKDNDYACGIRDLVSLVEDNELQELIFKALEKEGFYLPLSSQDNQNQTSKASRVVQGIPANLGQFPWQARFNFRTCDGNFLCGGVLISPCYVLTARHCADEWESDIRDDFTVTLGDLNRAINEPTEVTRNVYYVHFHPNKDYDVAILLLTQAPQFNNAIQPIPLSLGYPGFGQQATISGWGRTGFGSPPSDVLRFREINMPTFWWCHQYIADRIGDYQRHLRADEMCAGSLVNGNYAGSCHGDSGGPLAWRNPDNNNQWELVGISKRGVPDCPPEFEFRVYTSVVYSPIRGWINGILETATDPGGNGECRCNAQGTRIDSLQQAWWDGANCWMEPAPPGCSGGGFADIAGRQFVYGNRFYLHPHKAVNCPDATFDTCHCLRGPDLGTVSGVCPNPAWGTGNIFNFGGGSVPSPAETCAFEWSGNFYFTPQGTVAPAICPAGWYDGANCLYYSKVPSGSNAFLWPGDPNSNRNFYYGYPQQLNECGPDCFPPNSKVTLLNGTKTELKNIIIGDKILAMNPNKQPIFSSFLGWMHRDGSVQNFYLQIHSLNGSIKISPYHLIAVKEENGNLHKFIFAKDVSPGHFILQHSLENNVFTWNKVEEVTNLYERGLMAPLTEEGTIVVDDTLASCYAEISSHTTAHAALYPVRLVPSLLETTETENKAGLRSYIKNLIPMGRMLGLLRETFKSNVGPSVDSMLLAFQTALSISAFMFIGFKCM